MGAQAACLLIFVPDTVELAVSGPRSCCSLLERQRAAAGSLPRSLWRRRPVLDLPGGDIDHQLGGLAEIAGAFSMGRHGTVFACSGLSMQVALSRKNIQGGLALESRHKGAPGLGRARGSLFFEYDAGTLEFLGPVNPRHNQTDPLPKSLECCPSPTLAKGT